MNKDRKWQITLTEEQMNVMIEALDDWHRFICGQCSMIYATSYINNPVNMHLVRRSLEEQIKPMMFPELSLNASYSWNGGQPNPYMSKAAAISYMLYRQARHKISLASNPTESNSVYKYATLMCVEQGPMIKVELLNEG